MELSHNWLKELQPQLPDDPHRVAEKLTAIGLEVEAVRTVGQGLDLLRIAEVVTVRPHPSRDKLRLVTVRTDAGSPEQTVVCGASNVPDPGGLTVLAPEGATLPAIGMTLTPIKLGGVSSAGMLCSETELGLGADADGILTFEPGRFAPGTPFYTAFPQAADTIYSIGVTPNRPDALGHVGCARDLSAAFGVPFTMVRQEPAASGDAAGLSALIRVDNQAPDACPRYGAAVVRDVTVGPSPEWLRWRLTSLGIRPISNVVDVTNLMLLEQGNPMHAFDLRDVEERRIVIRHGRPDEKMTTLDDEERDLCPKDLVIADAKKPVALAGIMGGENSEIKPDTRDVLLEAAYFTPSGVRKTARRLGMSSDSSFRFERGVDWQALERLLGRASTLLRELANGTPLPGQLFADGNPPELPLIRLRGARLNSVLGCNVDFTEALTILERLGFGVLNRNAEEADVQGVSWRPDVTIEADLIEEVARIRGLDKIPTELPAIAPQRQGSANSIARRTRETSVNLGLSEAVCYSFVSRSDLEKLAAPAPVVTLTNPLTEDRDVMSTSLLPGLLEALRRSRRRGEFQVRLFTVGSVFLDPDPSKPGAQPGHPDDVGTLPAERLSFAAVLAGWRSSYLVKPEPVDVFDAKGIAGELLERLTGYPTDIIPGATPAMAHIHPRGAAQIKLRGKVVGHFGPLHPEVVDSFDLGGDAQVIELDLASIESIGRRVPSYRPIPRLPAVTRDIAIDATDEVSAGTLLAVIKDSAGELCESVELFDVFRDASLGEGRRSLAFRLVYRDPKASLDPEHAVTLTDKQVDRQHQNVLGAIEKLGVSPRA